MGLSDIVNMNVREFGQAFIPGVVAGLVFRIYSITSKQEVSQKTKLGISFGANGLVDLLGVWRYSSLNHDPAYNFLNDFGGVAGFFCGIETVDLFYHGLISIRKYFRR